MNLSIGILALVLVFGAVAVAAVAPTAEAIGGRCNGSVDATCDETIGGETEKCTAWVGKCIVG